MTTDAALLAGGGLLLGICALARWGPKERRINPIAPQMPAEVGAPVTAALMFAALVVMIVLYASRHLYVLSSVFGAVGAVCDYYWMRTRRWERSD